MDAATGNWLIFLGSDDSFYDETVLQERSPAAQTTAKVLYGNAKIIGDTGWAKDGEIYAGEFDLHKLLNQNICHQAMFYNSEFIRNEIGYFNLRYKKSSDWDFNLRCWAKHPFQYMDMTVANFLAGGFSTDSNDQAITDRFCGQYKNLFQYRSVSSLDK